MKPIRRTLLQAFALSPLAFDLSLPALAQSALTTTTLSDNLTLISGAGANVVVAVGPESVVVVDGGLDAPAQALLAVIDRLGGGKPIAALFNTNWRANKCGLNQVLAARGVPIIAHENTRLWQSADFYSEWQNLNHAPLPKAAQASKTFYDRGTLTLGKEIIDYGWIREASSDGDITVHFRGADVLVVSDVVSAGAYPLLDYVTGGWIGGAQKATRELLARSSDATRIVAAQGGVLNKTHLEQQATMLDHAYTKVAEAFKTGRSLAQFRATDPMQPFNAAWGNPELFLTLLYRGTWYHVPGRAVPGII
jgi:glyoxylase-like metal-dependent hydrolase (beta-lactamase superfamily II)